MGYLTEASLFIFSIERMRKITCKPAGRLLLNLVLVTFLIILCDQMVGKILRFFYFKQESGDGYRTTYAIDSTTTDIIIFGSSRANHSYVPEIFEKELNYSCYNSGRDGNYILYNYAIFKMIINRYHPGIVIFDIQPEGILNNKTEYDRLSILLPYYKTHNEIRRIINFRGPFEKIKFISAIYPFNSLILQIVMGNLERNKVRRPDFNGYIPLKGEIPNKMIDTTYYPSGMIDKNITNALEDIIYTCSEFKIDLKFVFSPVYSIIQDNTYVDLISELCNKNTIPFYNMSNDSIFINNPGYFYDTGHLNDHGARVFSAILIDRLWKTDCNSYLNNSITNF